MADIHVRTRWRRALNDNQEEALRLLGDHARATVGNATEVTADGRLIVHGQTAMSLMRFNFIERSDDGIAITREGLIKIGKAQETRAERQHKEMARSLEAQRSGEWVPAAAGESARASEDYEDARRERGQVHSALLGARSNLDFYRDMLDLCLAWGGSPDEAARCRVDIERAEKRVVSAKAAVDALPPVDQAA
jgi:hypothetical protein